MTPRALLLLCFLLCACGGGTADDDRRLVTVDIGPDIRALGSDDLFESDPALERILAIGKPAVPVLADALADEPANVRVGIIDALRRIGGAEVVPVVISAATDADPEVRYESLIALSKLGDERARSIVEAAVEDPEPSVRRGAAHACAQFCRSAPALEALVSMSIHSEDLATAMAARSSLKVILESSDDGVAAAAREAIVRDAIPSIEAALPLDARVRAALLACDIGSEIGTRTLAQGVLELDSVPLVIRVVYVLGDVGGVESVAAVAAFAERPGLGLYGYDALRRMAARGVPGAEEVLGAYSGPRPNSAIPAP